MCHQIFKSRENNFQNQDWVRSPPFCLIILFDIVTSNFASLNTGYGRVYCGIYNV